MAFTFPAMVAWDPNGKQNVKNVSFQVYAVTDTTFTTPLALTDTFNNPLPGNILNSGTAGVFPQFQQATNSTVVITDATHVYAWTVNCVQQDTATASFINTVGTATQTALSATYAPVSGSTNYAPASGSASYASRSNNLSDLANAVAARGNLGLGDAATHPATDFLAVTQKAVALGLATLDSGTKVPVAQIPDLSATYAPLTGAARDPLTGLWIPEKFGTITYGKGVTSAQAQANAAAMQAAIDASNNGGGIAANTTGGGAILVRDVIECYTAGAPSALVTYSGVQFVGLGLGGDVFSGTDPNLPFRGSAVRLWGGANQDLIRTANFAALTGTTNPSAYATPNRFGFFNLVLDGNKANNTSGDVLKIYGRSFTLHNIVIQNGAGRGLYTEYGTSAGYDNESHIDKVRITDNVSDGWLFKGPHDSQISKVFCCRNGGSGFVTSGAVGSLQVDQMHNWGNAVYNYDIPTSGASFVNCSNDGAGGGGKAGMRLASYTSWMGGDIYGTNTPGEVLVQLGDGTTALTITGNNFHTRWWNVANGSVLLAYMSNITLGYNVWRGLVNNGTNSRFQAGNGRAQISGAQTLPVTTLNVVSTTGFPTSGSLYTAGGTISYTGITSTSFTGVTGGSSVTLADQSWILQSNTISTLGETYEFRSADGNAALNMQTGGLSTAIISETVQRDQIGQLNVRSMMSASQTLASNGAVTLDVSKGNAQNVTLQANATSTTIINPTNSQELVLTYIQDATGGRTYVWPANCKFAGGSAPSDTTASKRTTVRFKYESATSAWWETARSVAVG